MGNISLTLPVIGQPNSTEDTKIRDSLSTIQTVINGNLDDSNLVAASRKTAILGQPTLLFESAGSAISGGVAAGNYVMTSSGGMTQVGIAAGAVSTPRLFPIVSANHAVSGMTTNLRVEAILTTNSVAPTGNWAVGLCVPTVAGPASNMSIPTTGGFIGGSTTFTAPAASSVLSQSYTMVLPANGIYAVILVLSATQAVNSIVGINCSVSKYYT